MEAEVKSTEEQSSAPPAAEAKPSSEPETEVKSMEGQLALPAAATKLQEEQTTPPPVESKVPVATTRKRKISTNEGLTVELRPRRKKKDKAVPPAKKKNIEFMKVDDDMKVDNDASHLHIFPSGSSGKDRLLSVAV
jgi:hypothetical protein